MVELASSDAPEMVRLATDTEPGPFASNMHLTGRWFGVHRPHRRAGIEVRREVTVAVLRRDGLRVVRRRIPHGGPPASGGWPDVGRVGRWVRAYWTSPPSLPRRGLTIGRPSSRSVR